MIKATTLVEIWPVYLKVDLELAEAQKASGQIVLKQKQKSPAMSCKDAIERPTS